jgi:hypothetical protein
MTYPHLVNAAEIDSGIGWKVTHVKCQHVCRSQISCVRIFRLIKREYMCTLMSRRDAMHIQGDTNPGVFFHSAGDSGKLVYELQYLEIPFKT